MYLPFGCTGRTNRIVFRTSLSLFTRMGLCLSFARTLRPQVKSVFRTYLDRSMAYLLAAGFQVTNDLNAIRAYSWDGLSQRTPRRPSRRLSPID